MRWTGGQYSIYRVVLAAFTTTVLIRAAGAAWPVDDSAELVHRAVGGLGLAIAILGAGALAIGLHDRLAAQLLAPAVLVAELLQRGGEEPPPLLDLFAGRTSLLLAILLLAHARIPIAPFGSVAARERVDPRGGWQRPAWQTELGLTLLVVVFGARLAEAVLETDRPALLASGFELALALVARFDRPRRASVWAALLLFHIAWSAAVGLAPGDAQIFLLLAFATEPTAFPGRSLVASAEDATRDLRQPARLFYDGSCGFCHRSVRFVLAEELATPERLRLRFAPLGSETFAARLAAHPELDPNALPDSIVLELEDASIRTRSAAALEIASRLGGIWRLLALAGSFLPSPLLDHAYDAIARVRKRLFANPKDACPILPPDLRARFDL